MKLYSGPLSLFSAKARIALAEKAIDFDLVSVGWSRADRYLPHHPDVLALNPKAQVPVLVDGDAVVYDSTQIFEYLEDRVPEPALYPSEIGARAACRQLEAAADEIWFPHVWDLIEARFYADGSAEASAAERASAGLVSLYPQLEKDLLGRNFLIDGYSVADIATFIQVHTAGVLGVPVPEDCVAVAAWRERVSERPAVQPVLADMMQAAAEAMS